MSTITIFTGQPWGDNTCFCWAVDSDTYRRIVGERRFLMEVEHRDEENDLWLLYPGDLMPEYNGPHDLKVVPKYRFKLTVEEL